MPHASTRAGRTGIAHGDRVIYLGIGQRRGQHGDALSPRKQFAGVRFDDGSAFTCLTADLHPIPRRPPPMF
ncbi:hypothetical protein LQ953_13200 [Sphingomonas sp. IC-56]|uniref:hypothetical protein n=1 Tax=Sphingomonas sp. IC-56 TaxID=2898529 RepID=UPI001E2D3357|nr:hypothetical protein [Sphingomonas sp. IC-56]MCD2324974.1 hypothetical protein [Sphingomonas sp. IC-56]